MRMKNDLMAEAKLHDVDPCEGSGVGVEGDGGGGGVAAGLKRCGGIHPIAIIYLSHVECVSTSTQRPPNHHHHRRATPPFLSSAPSSVTTHWAGIYGIAVGQLSLIFIMSHACTVSS